MSKDRVGWPIVLLGLAALLLHGCVVEGFPTMSAEVVIRRADGARADGPWAIRYTWFDDAEAALAAPTPEERDRLRRARNIADRAPLEFWHDSESADGVMYPLAFLGSFQQCLLPLSYLNPWFYSTWYPSPTGLWIEAFPRDLAIGGRRTGPVQVFVVVDGELGCEVHRVEATGASARTTMVGIVEKARSLDPERKGRKARRITLVLRDESP